jgi:hypothetical protein
MNCHALGPINKLCNEHVHGGSRFEKSTARASALTPHLSAERVIKSLAKTGQLGDLLPKTAGAPASTNYLRSAVTAHRRRCLRSAGGALRAVPPQRR